MIWPLPMDIPTWLTGEEYVTRSPGCNSLRDTDGNPACPPEVRGMVTPACAQAQEVSPEQSNELGPAAP